MTDIKSEILSKLDIGSFYGEHVKWVTQKGKNWKGFCPFHDETDGSFFVQISTGLFNCFGCNAKGDVFNFQERIANQNFNEALKALAERTGTELPKIEKKKTTKKKSNHPKLNEGVCEKLHSELTTEMLDCLIYRGISKEIIDKYQVGSFGNYFVFPIRKNGNLYNYRFKRFKENDNQTKIWHLTEENLRGKDPLWIFPEPKNEDIVFIVEGEIDSLNAISLGLNAFTFTGGAGTWRDDAAKFLKDKTVYICYDIDAKGRVGSKHIAQKVALVAKEVRIINLDLDLEKYPNGDLNDYFVKEKKTIDDFNKLVKDSKVVVQVPEDVNIIEDENCYWSLKETKKGKIITTRISNFVIKLECKYRSTFDNTVTREIRLISSNKKVNISGKHLLEASAMSASRYFRQFCLSCGDFVFDGNDGDLNGIWQLVIAQDPISREVKNHFGIGYIPNLGIWMFENFAIRNNELFVPDENGICWNKNCGYSFMPLEASGGNVTQPSPKLIIDLNEKNDTGEVIRELASTLFENVGTLDSYLAISLACGSVYFNDIIKEFGCFPILWAYGKLRCGKNEFVGFLMRLFGLGRNDNESLPGITSTVPITRRLSYYGSIPVWFDEYRNNLKNVEMIKGVFRSAYNASGRSLGMKASHGVIKERITAPLFVSGEELPEDDEALLSRLIVVHLKKASRNDSLYSKVFNLSQKSSSHIFNLIKRKNETTVKELVSTIEHFRHELSSKNEIDARIALNYSIVLGCYTYLVDKSDVLLRDYIMSGMAFISRRDVQQENEKGSSILLSNFIESISVLISEGQFNNVSWNKIQENSLYIWLPPLYEKWAMRHKMITGEKPVSYKTLIDHLKETDYVIEISSVQRIFDNDTVKTRLHKCIHLDITKMPEQMRGWFQESEE